MRKKRLTKQESTLLDHVESAEAAFLVGRRSRGEDLESAVRIFLEFLRGFEAMAIDRKCVTVFGSARFNPGYHDYHHSYDELARALGRIDSFRDTDDADLAQMHQFLEHRHSDDGLAGQARQVLEVEPLELSLTSGGQECV